MRLAVLSDIHSNLSALEAVRDDLPDVDQIWVLGDIVGYGPQPNEVVRALQGMGARSVMGNHDGAAIGTVDVGWFNPDAARAIEWTSEVADDNARAYLATLPAVRRDSELTAVHGSPRDPTWEYITGTRAATENLDAFETRLCLHGHTHVPVIFRADDGLMEIVPATPDQSISIAGGRLLLNPGSVGQPRDGNPAASYLLIDTELGIVEFRRIRYDIARTQQRMREAGLPPRLVERLAYGR